MRDSEENSLAIELNHSAKVSKGEDRSQAARDGEGNSLAIESSPSGEG
jgi:hypothetical protein